MAPAIVRRAIVKRNVVEGWGKSLQSWVQHQPPATVFVLTVVLAFLMALVLLSLIWETIRKCRSSYRANVERRQAEWIQLPDGSSVLTQGRAPDARELRQGDFRPGAYLPPMTSLLREARQGGSTEGAPRQEPRYVPAQTGSSREMVADSQTAYAPYDPPLPHSNFQRQSTGSTSRWSEQTKVISEYEFKEKKDQVSLNLPAARTPPVSSSTPVPSIPPPPRPTPSNPSSSTITAIPLSSPRARPIGVGHVRQASSGGFQPKGLTLVKSTSIPAANGVVGEDRFSTPKSTPNPLSSLRSSVTASIGGWSVPTLAASPAPSEDSKKTFVSSTSIFPPRVDLKRSGTWSSSLSSWIPGYSGTDEKAGEEEETKRLVDQALKNAR